MELDESSNLVGKGHESESSPSDTRARCDVEGTGVYVGSGAGVNTGNGGGNCVLNKLRATVDDDGSDGGAGLCDCGCGTGPSLQPAKLMFCLCVKLGTSGRRYGCGRWLQKIPLDVWVLKAILGRRSIALVLGAGGIGGGLFKMNGLYSDDDVDLFM